MNGKSVPPGLIGKMLKAASAEKTGEFSKLSATSTPQQITKAVIDMREAVENVMRNAYVQDYLEGADEMGPARAFAFSVLVAKFPEAQLKSVKDAFRSETMSKIFAVMDDLIREKRPAGAKPVSRVIFSFIREQSMVLEQAILQYKKAVESLLGQEEGDGVRPFEGPFDKTAFGDKDIHDLLIPLAERDEAAELDAERRQEYMPRAFRPVQRGHRLRHSRRGQRQESGQSHPHRALALRRKRRSRQLRRREHRQDSRLGQRNASHA